MLGDCGSWVVNAQNGDIFGHIVAGDITSGLAYIIPAYKVFDDIELRFGSRPVLPTQTVIDKFRASELSQESSDSLRANRHTEGDPSSSRRIPVSGKGKAAPSSVSPSSASPSFMVKIEGIRPNYTIQPQRSTENKHGFFLPPDRRTAFNKEDAVCFRWHRGKMSTMHNGSINIASLGTAHSAVTIFSQKDDTDHLLAVDFNALFQDVIPYDPGWRVLRFDHIPKPHTSAIYSSINLFGEEKHLAAGGSPTWMGQLLPREYNYQRTTPGGRPIPSPTGSAGLIGSLPILIGLAAFSAPEDSLTAVLTSSIKPQAWRRHNLPTGRTPERGMVVTIYYDPMNPEFSNKDILDRLQNGEWGPFYA